MRVLVVDDNHDILALLQRLLQNEGHQVVLARNGLEALQQEAVTQPDLIICDVNLPVLDGWEVCRRVKARRAVPIMLLTVRVEQVDIDQSYAVGADDHFSKPFDIPEFLERVALLMQRIVPPATSRQ